MKKLQRSPKRPRKADNEQWPSADFAAFVKEAVDEAADLGPAAQAHVLANCRLQADYPGEYVAFVDTFTGRGKKLRFRRRMLAHAENMGDLHEQLAKLRLKDRSKITYRYVDDPEGPLEVHYDLPFHG